jgi:hypothetical protein
MFHLWASIGVAGVVLIDYIAVAIHPWSLTIELSVKVATLSRVMQGGRASRSSSRY